MTSASAFGRLLTDIDLTIDPRTRDITPVDATTRLVDRTDAQINTDSDLRLQYLAFAVTYLHGRRITHRAIDSDTYDAGIIDGIRECAVGQ